MKTSRLILLSAFLFLLVSFQSYSGEPVKDVVNGMLSKYYAADECSRYIFYSNDKVSQEAQLNVAKLVDEFSQTHEDAVIFLWSEYQIVNDLDKLTKEYLEETTTLVCNSLSDILVQRKIFVLRVSHIDLIQLVNGEGTLDRKLFFIPATNDADARHCVTEAGLLEGLGQALDEVYTDVISNFIDQISNCGGVTISQNVRFLASVTLTSVPNFAGNRPDGSDKDIEDHAGLSSQEKQEIKDWLGKFGASAKIFISSEKTAWVDDLSVSNITKIEEKFINLDFDGKDMAVWLHYDEENQQIHIKHAFGKNVLRINPDYESLENHVPTSIDELTAISDGKVQKALETDDWMTAPPEKESLGFIQSVVAVKNWTKDILANLQVPPNMWDDELGESYQSSPVNIFPYLGGLGDGTFEEIRSLPELVILGIDVAVDKPFRDQMINAIGSISLEDVKKMAVTMYTESADIYSQGGSKAGHLGGKHTIQIATIVLPITKAGKLKKGAELAEEGMGSMADLLRKVSKDLQDQIAKLGDDQLKRQLVKDLTDDSNLLKAFDDAALEGRDLVDAWNVLKNTPDGIRKGINSLTTVSKWLDEGIELTFEAMQDGARILNKNGDEVGKLLKEGSDEILEISDDFFVSGSSSTSKKFDGITIRSNTGETFTNAGFVKNADGSIGFVEDVSSYGSQAVQNTIKQRGALRSSLTGIKATEDAHHLIPVQLLKENDVVKKAVEAGFEFNTTKNGLAIEKFVKKTGAGRHGPHPSYTEQIREYLDRWTRLYPSYTPQMAKAELEDIVDLLKTKINSSTDKINELKLGL